MINERLTCIDAGSEYCPCYLSETNDCLICTQLQGKGFCDCAWTGVCIYQDFNWCGNKRKNSRDIYNGSIIDKKNVGDKGILLKIKVTKTLARQLKHPGAYVFIREPRKPHFFDVPMSVMSADEHKGEIEIAVEILGVKTKALLECDDSILIKGPFWNGILGMKYLKNTKGKNILVIARGMALAPSLLVIKYLLKHNNKIDFMMDPGKIKELFIKDYIKDLDIQAHEINLRTEQGLDRIRQRIQSGEYDLIFSAGADKLHNIILNEIDKSGKQIHFVVTNNSHICCGEGVCGACTCKTSNGSIAKMCKTQLDVREALERRK